MSIRLGAGELNTAEGVTAWAREFFLEAIEMHAPEVLGNLRQTVLPAYMAEREFFVEFKAWGERWHLDEEWIYARALDTLEIWAGIALNLPIWGQERVDGAVVEWSPALLGFHWIPREPALVLRWDPRGEFKDVARRRGIAAVNRFLDEVEQSSKVGGGVLRAPRKDSPEHFMWEVCYRVNGETARSIAERCHTESHHVIKTVKEIEHLVGLRPRASGRQRRRSSPVQFAK